MRDPDLPDPPPRRDRGKLGKLIRRRPRVNTGAALIMSLGFALVASLLVLSDSVLMSAGTIEYKAGEPAPVTLRVAQFQGFRDGTFDLRDGPIAIPRGQMVDEETARIATAIIDKRPLGWAAIGAYMAAFFLIAMIYTTQLRRSHRGRLLRTQGVTLLLLLCGAAVCKIGLLFSPLSVFTIPVAAAAIVATLVVDVSAGLATGLLASVLCGLMVPLDLGVIVILGVQSVAAVLVVGENKHKNRHVLLAGLVSGLAAVLAYVVLHYLTTLDSPLYDLSDPLRATVFAAAVGGLVSSVAAIIGQPIYQFLLGDITRNKLVELEDLSNPLLKQIAQDSPGTWQHSLAMANMAEVATQAIGGNGRLVRVGAYYHDLGKSLQPKYFIENLQPGEASPHDRLPPEVSCDAIFAHVTEGIRVARKSGLPERIIDFMHMHHGDGLLQYFWTKCQESGNARGLTVEDFRYPGIPPQSRETAILAIVDAVEAASRTLKSNDDAEISKLVQRIVYGKLHLGQLDESGLSMADLRKISDSLRESIKHGRHGRIEYPWQREERAAAEAAKAARRAAAGQSADDADPSSGVVASAMPATRTQRLMHEPRLDSLDAPRPYWRESRSQAAVPAAPPREARVEKPPRESTSTELAALAESIESELPAELDEPAVKPRAAEPARPPAEPARPPAEPVRPPVEPDRGRDRDRPGPGPQAAPPAATVGQRPGARASDPPWASSFRTGQQKAMAGADDQRSTGPLVLPKKKKKLIFDIPGESNAALPPGADLNATAPLPKIDDEPPSGTSNHRPSDNTTPITDMASAPTAPAPPPARTLVDDPAARVLARAKAEAENLSQGGPLSFDDEPTSVATSLGPSPLKSGFSPELPPDLKRPPPPPGSAERSKSSTIELMKEARAATSEPIAEDEIEGEELLTPGTLVLGPPPATRPREPRTREMPGQVVIKPKKRR